jgi:hypothetical protein
MSELTRAMKKILQATTTVTSSLELFNKLDTKSKGYLEPNELLDGLNSLGSNLSKNEFNLLLRKIDANHDGKIDIKDFDSVLHNEVNNEEKRRIDEKSRFLSSHSRYSNTFKSNNVLKHHSQELFNKMTDTKEYRRDKLAWDKIKVTLKITYLLFVYIVPLKYVYSGKVTKAERRRSENIWN